MQSKPNKSLDTTKHRTETLPRCIELHAGGTRTCIQTHSDASEYTVQDLQRDTVEGILADTQLVYFDGRLIQAATVLAKAAGKEGIPVLVEAERLRPGLDDLLQEADFLSTSAHFPEVPIHPCSLELAQTSFLLCLVIIT